MEEALSHLVHVSGEKKKRILRNTDRPTDHPWLSSVEHRTFLREITKTQGLKNT